MTSFSSSSARSQIFFWDELITSAEQDRTPAPAKTRQTPTRWKFVPSLLSLQRNALTFPSHVHPVAFQIGSFVVYWYGILTALGFLAAFWTSSRRAPREGLAPEV